MAPRGPRFIRTIIVVSAAALLLTVFAAGCAEKTSEIPSIENEPPVGEAPAPEEVDDGEAAAQTDEGQPEETPADGDQVEDAGAVEDEQAAADQQSAQGEDAENVKTIVRIKTGKGDIVAELYDERMPITTGNFLLLADKDYYTKMTFHRVVPDFVIQGGDPTGTGMGGPGWSIPLESPGKIHHEEGVLSMARSNHPDSAGSQFFVCLSNNQSVQSLDTLMGGYAAFGKVTEGMDVAKSIDVGDTLDDVEIVSESPHADAAREAAKKARIE